MSFNVATIPAFDKQIKRLAKKYPSLKEEYNNLLNKLEENPVEGTPLGNNCYKIRIAISSKGKGKSGGGRIITHIVIKKKTVYLLSVYDKSEHETISASQINELLKLLP